MQHFRKVLSIQTRAMTCGHSRAKGWWPWATRGLQYHVVPALLIVILGTASLSYRVTLGQLRDQRRRSLVVPGTVDTDFKIIRLAVLRMAQIIFMMGCILLNMLDQMSLINKLQGWNYRLSFFWLQGSIFRSEQSLYTKFLSVSFKLQLTHSFK